MASSYWSVLVAPAGAKRTRTLMALLHVAWGSTPTLSGLRTTRCGFGVLPSARVLASSLHTRQDHEMAAAEWSSLEVAKLIVTASIPLVVVLLGLVVSRAARRVEDAQWANRKVIERRLDLYDEMATALNDLYCFFALVGTFREVDPPKAVARKRQLDKTFHVNEYLMGPEFGERYAAF